MEESVITRPPDFNKINIVNHIDKLWSSDLGTYQL